MKLSQEYSMAWKYIMVQVDDRAVPIIFPQELVHAEVYRRLARVFYDQAKMKDPVVVGAGFVEGLACCIAMGESETLDIKARPEDTQIINNHPYEKGIPTPLSNMTEGLLLQKTIELLMLRKQEIGG
jgi:hypothetical protein